ncbi:hypothetical protein RS030_152301 [Cryptosporidium xiaoi]|uniref:Uncharacterized protein n=1 Tax=Cryptosporidium xiaoi TaxID=659607 RepID=A0AAV9Y0W7_9CRYT
MSSFDNHLEQDRSSCFSSSNLAKKEVGSKYSDLGKKNLSIIYLDDSDNKVRRENSEVMEKNASKMLTVYQRIQISFLICLAITNMIIFIIAFSTRK